MRSSEDFVENFVEISTGKEKVGKNGKMALIFLLMAKSGSTGRQNSRRPRFVIKMLFCTSKSEGLPKYCILASKSSQTSMLLLSKMAHFHQFSCISCDWLFWNFPKIEFLLIFEKNKKTFYEGYDGSDTLH